MGAKIAMLVCFFAVMLGIGWYYRKTAQRVSDFVIGGREEIGRAHV